MVKDCCSESQPGDLLAAPPFRFVLETDRIADPDMFVPTSPAISDCSPLQKKAISSIPWLARIACRADGRDSMFRFSTQCLFGGALYPWRR